MDDLDGGVQSCLPKESDPNADDGSDPLLGKEGITSIVPVDISKNDLNYNMNHSRRGFALLFDHQYFDFKKKGINTRSGSEKDCLRLQDILENLGFEVHVFQDLKADEIEKHLMTFSKLDHSQNDCFLVTVLSHGDMSILYAKDKSYKIGKLWKYFTAERCPSLAGKPKLYFIQACMGTASGKSVILSRTQMDGNSNNDTYSIPNESDFLVMYSTTPGYVSHRNTARGSWFIQSLCDVFSENAYNYDLLTLLTYVCHKVAVEYETGKEDFDKNKQLPTIVSHLLRIFRFNQKHL